MPITTSTSPTVDDGVDGAARRAPGRERRAERPTWRGRGRRRSSAGADGRTRRPGARSAGRRDVAAPSSCIALCSARPHLEVGHAVTLRLQGPLKSRTPPWLPSPHGSSRGVSWRPRPRPGRTRGWRSCARRPCNAQRRTERPVRMCPSSVTTAPLWNGVWRSSLVSSPHSPAPKPSNCGPRCSSNRNSLSAASNRSTSGSIRRT